MYNSILPQKCKVNVSIFFQKFNIPFINFGFGKTSSSIKYRSVSIGQVYQLICCVNVRIFPFIMYFTTATRFCASRNGLKFSTLAVLKCALFFVWFTQKKNVPLSHVSQPFSFLYLKCSPNCNKYSLYQRFLKSTKILVKLINLSSKCVCSSSLWLINIVLSLRPMSAWCQNLVSHFVNKD